MQTDSARIIPVKLRQARIRINARRFISTFGTWLGCTLLLVIAWQFASPILEIPNVKFWNGVAISISVLGSLFVASWVSWRRSPSDLEVALQVDREFQLQERLTATCSLAAELAETPVGLALSGDARTAMEKIKISDRFSIRPGKRGWFIPAEVAVIVLVWFLYHPANLGNWAFGKNSAEENQTQPDLPPADKVVTSQKPVLKRPPERPDQFKDSKELQDLQIELEKLYAENGRDKSADLPEKIREKISEVAKTEEALRKQEEKMAEKFQKLQAQLDSMTQMGKGESRPDGPAKEFEEALAKGDLKTAQEEADRLKKKAREKKLDQNDADQLKREIEKMEQRADQLHRENEKKEKQLKDLIKQAKNEKRDADSLERELKDLQQQMSAPKEAQKLAEALQQAKKALEQKDFDGVADQMEELSKQLGEMQSQLQDLEDVEEHLQNLKELKKNLCKECEGQGDQKGKPGHSDNSKGFAEGASGKREENKDALTKKGEESQVRGFFDARGRKRYGGTTNGPAFKQKSTAEMAGEIQQAAQEAPDAVEVQRLPRAAKDMVREYFEKLGGQSPKK